MQTPYNIPVSIQKHTGSKWHIITEITPGYIVIAMFAYTLLTVDRSHDLEAYHIYCEG